MNEREFFQARRKAEKDTFLRVIRALPNGKLDYKTVKARALERLT